jgi:flagellar hook-associated protein 2
MAITLDGLTRNATAGQKAGVPVSTKADLATGAFDLASKSVGQDATNVQLSPFGQVKSSFVDVQTAGRTLSTPAKTSTIEDATKSVQSFTNAYNNATRIINTASNSTGALAASGQTNSASIGLKNVVTSGNNTADLKNIGVSVNQDGTISVDTKALQSAVQANPGLVQDTLAKVGAQAVLVSQKVLSGTSNIGDTVNTLSARVKNQGAKATGQQKPAAGSQNSAQQQTENAGSNTAGGIAAYIQMISR